MMGDGQMVYLAIGLPYGAVVTPTSKAPRCSMRLGKESVRMPLSVYHLWRKALKGQSHEELRRVAEANGDLDAFSHDMQRLLDAGALIPWAGRHENLPLFERLRVLPCGVSGGNLAEHPELFALLSLGDQNPVLWVDVLAFTLYAHFDGIATLDEACATTAKRLDYQVDEVRERALTLVPVLMRSGLVFIDLAVR